MVQTFHWRQRTAIPVVAAGMHILYDGSAAHFWPGYVIALLTTTLMWEGHLAILTAARRRYPRPDQTAHRFLVQVPAHVAYTLVASATINWVVSLLVVEHCFTSANLLRAFLLNLIPTGLVILIYETVYFFQQWKANLTRVEALARTAAQSELDALRQQLDPHFLFNSLNTLAALIDDNEPAVAQQYLSRLADVYRYVLLAKDRETVPLAEELAFVDAYLALNKVRFRENLLVENTIPPDCHQRRVAPLSVQTLVENALKHNVVSREHPLALRLEAAGPDAVRVVNSVRLKTTFGASTRVGLRNLISRYALLTASPVEVIAGTEEFSVSLPLL